MEYREAVKILTRLLEKHMLDKEEKEAVLTAIGLLDMGSIAKASIRKRIKKIKAKKEKDIEW